jgi:hypothetical protein
MFLDALGLVSDAQAVTADAYSTNTVDLGNVNPDREIGTGEPVGFGLSIDVAADATTGDETYTFIVVQSDNADLSSHDALASYTLTAAQLAAGALFFLEIPIGFPTKRYVGIRYDVGGTTPSVTATAWLTARSMFSKLAKAYARNYTV